MAIKDRLKARRAELDLTLEDVAKVTGVTRATVQKYETGIISNIPSDKIELLAKALRTTPAYIMGWEESSFLPGNIQLMPELVKKPRLGTIACGDPVLAEQNIEGYDDVPAYVNCDFTLVCKGDSMINARINNGDIVCVKQQSDVLNGQIAAVLVDGEFESEATLKRFYRNGDTITLVAENPSIPPFVFVGEDANRVHIIGLATHFISKVK